MRRTRRWEPRMRLRDLVLPALVALPLATAQSNQCISLANSTACSAFNRSSISTSSTLINSFPFLAFVSNIQQFDQQLMQYIATTYAQDKYQTQLGCQNLKLSNTTFLYARYTASNICNGIVQNSKTPCNLSQENAQPLCADSCARFAQSEQMIVSYDATCMKPNQTYLDQIRADFTNCALPANSISGQCIEGVKNEPNNCGFATNTLGLCEYCASRVAFTNGTDGCCTNSDLAGCANVTYPASSTLPPLFPSSTAVAPSSSPSSTDSAAAGSGGGLSGGQIAGIVVGSVVFALLLLACCLFLCLRRRRRGSQDGSIFNQPTPSRRGGQPMTATPVAQPTPATYDPAAGGRVAQMSALQPGVQNRGLDHGAEAGLVGAGAAAGLGAAAVTSRRHHNQSSSDEYGGTPDSRMSTRGGHTAGGPPRRGGSLSSTSMLAAGENPSSSPHTDSGGNMTSPEGMASQQSEQLPFFKDYYSQDEIHPDDRVAVLWAYQPRAGDEFELERGDMLKVVGIWDDGWATGLRLNDRAEDWGDRAREQRDSGLSGQKSPTPPPSGDIKAFPLVCVCLPQHWKRTIEGDSNSSGDGPPGPPPI